MPVCDRDDYFEQVIKALRRCNRINETVLILSQDCSDKAISKRIEELMADAEHLRLIHMKHIRPFFGIPSFHDNEYATTANVYFLLRFAFDYLEAEGAIILESDLVPSVDFYEYHLWMFQHFLSSKPLSDDKLPEQVRSRVLSINSFNFDSRQHSNPLKIRPYEFTVWGWSTSRSNWINYIKPEFTWFNGWDIAIQKYARRKHELICLQPELSRVKNIGQHGINFNVDNTKWKQSYDLVYINSEQNATEYGAATPVLIDIDEYSICKNAKICDPKKYKVVSAKS
ncbi:hypothetical protein MP638_007052 [Amoeboaphelidium occidentale]|nr:hypothetical protein MP638_007052 [Amoeboaphelidium occidentale]